jgi:hypothetical protein
LGRGIDSASTHETSAAVKILETVRDSPIEARAACTPNFIKHWRFARDVVLSGRF